MPLSEYAALPAGPLWLPVRSLDPPPPDGRQGVVPLEDTSAPFAYLHDAVDESFRALRDRIGIEAGWDLLSSLESAYIPLTEAPAPTMDDNWLMTGRGFTLNPMPLHAGWMLLIKEDFNGQTYWRVYLKARYQDGSLGLPVTQSSWDLNARYTGGSRAYEAGGRAGQSQLVTGLTSPNSPPAMAGNACRPSTTGAPSTRQPGSINSSSLLGWIGLRQWQKYIHPKP
jgi:hypothetical protein